MRGVLHLLAVDRKNKIKDILSEKKSITVTELTGYFDVTEETIRRDLKLLAKEGFLKKTYGGAYITDGVQNDVNVNLREHIHVEGKKKIAKRCLELIKMGDSIFLDASTTALVLATMLDDKKLTVVTNSLKIINILAVKKNITTIVIGGTLYHNSLSHVGPGAESYLQNYYYDTAFISCRSISMLHGITDSNEQQANVRKTVVSHANLVCLMLDHTKINRTSFVKICEFGQINQVVTDEALTSDWREFLTERNIAYYDH